LLCKFGRKWLLALILLSISLPPVIGQHWYDATHLFKKEVEWLADNVEKETRAEYQFRTNGFLAYADRKPPEVGDTEVFTTCNIRKNVPEQIKAVLKKIGKHCYVYLETGHSVDSNAIKKIADHFDKKIYPEVRSMFGSEWSPGIDGDKRITLLLLDIKDAYNPSQGRKGFVAGYFYAGDEYNRSKNPNSNEREMLYLDISPGVAGSEKFLSVIAHEFQHMVHWNNDPKEYDWVDESLSQLAPFLCGYGHPPQIYAFLRNPDNNMCAWSKENMLANYGQVYLWAYYIATHISSTEERRRAFVRKMVEQKSQGLSGLNAAIKKQRIKNNVANLFKSFCVANYLNDSSFARGAYGYDKHLARLSLKPELKVSSVPARGKATVKCWSAKAIRIDDQSIRGKEVRLSFAGQKIQSGKYHNRFDVAFVTWSSGRNDQPQVEWLTVRLFKAAKDIKIPAKHDKMMIIVVNRGPDTMKIEQAYAKGAGPAAFAFALSLAAAPIADVASPQVATRSGRSNGARRSIDRSNMHSMVEEIAAANLFENNSDILSQIDTTARSASEIEFDLEFQRISKLEDQLVDEIKAGIEANEFELLNEFIDIYNTGSEEKRNRLNALRSRILDILRFEEMQGNSTVTSFKTNLEE
jgi:hypothetical protein